MRRPGLSDGLMRACAVPLAPGGRLAGAGQRLTRLAAPECCGPGPSGATTGAARAAAGRACAPCSPLCLPGSVRRLQHAVRRGAPKPRTGAPRALRPGRLLRAARFALPTAAPCRSAGPCCAAALGCAMPKTRIPIGRRLARRRAATAPQRTTPVNARPTLGRMRIRAPARRNPMFLTWHSRGLSGANGTALAATGIGRSAPLPLPPPRMRDDPRPGAPGARGATRTF